MLSCLATSVLPTPVGPENKYEPIGLPSSLNPALASLIDDESSSIAFSCPKTNVFKSLSKFLTFSLSFLLTDFVGILAIRATTDAISLAVMIFFLFEL